MDPWPIIAKHALHVAGTAAALFSSAAWLERPQVLVEMFGEQCAGVLLFAACCGASFTVCGFFRPLYDHYISSWAGGLNVRIENTQCAPPESHSLGLTLRTKRIHLGLRRRIAGGIAGGLHNLLSRVPRRYVLELVPQVRVVLDIGHTRQAQWAIASPARQQQQQQEQSPHLLVRKRRRSQDQCVSQRIMQRIKVPANNLVHAGLSPQYTSLAARGRQQLQPQQQEPLSPASSSELLSEAGPSDTYSKLHSYVRSCIVNLSSPSSPVTPPQSSDSWRVANLSFGRLREPLTPPRRRDQALLAPPLVASPFQEQASGVSSAGPVSHPLSDITEEADSEEISTPLSAALPFDSARVLPPRQAALSPLVGVPTEAESAGLAGAGFSVLVEGSQADAQRSVPPAGALMQCPELEWVDPQSSVGISCGQDSGRGGCPSEVGAVVTDTHLMQFGALIGETSSREALAGSGEAWAVGGGPASFLGMSQSSDCCWEQMVKEEQLGLTFTAWRAPLRNGLYMYCHRAVYEDADIAALRAFALDDHARDIWDNNHVRTVRLPLEGGNSSRHSCLHYYRSRLAKFMKDREYVYARRVWDRPSDSGCYAISIPCQHAEAPLEPRSAQHVTDHASAFVIRAVPSAQGSTRGAVEMVTVYYEDPHMNARIMNSAVKHSCWGVTKRHESAFRVYAAARLQRKIAHAERSHPHAHISVTESALPEGDSERAASQGEDDIGSNESAGGSLRRNSCSSVGEGSETGMEWSYAQMRECVKTGGCEGHAGSGRWRRRGAIATAAIFIAVKFL